LDCRHSQDFKLLTQKNLPEMIQRARAETNWSQSAVRSLSAYGRGVGEGALAPSTLAVTGLVMTPLVALLMGINIGLVPGMGLSGGGDDGDAGRWDAGPGLDGTQGVNDTTGAWTGATTDGWTSGKGGSTPSHILAAEHALKATVSSLLMAVLAGAATGVGQWVGRHADADCLAAVFGAVRAAAQQLRGGNAASPTQAAVELTGVRRRTAVHPTARTMASRF
jgi:hypothetical protein